MNINDIVILGLLAEKPKHGYEIKKDVELRGLNEWASIKMPSIYHRLKVLLKEGYITLDTVEKEGNMPEKNVYRILDAGYGYLKRNIIEALTRRTEGHDHIVAQGFMTAVLDQDVFVALQEKLAFLKQYSGEHHASHDHYDFIPPNWKILIGMGSEIMAVEVKWTQKMIDAIVDGTIPLRGAKHD